MTKLEKLFSRIDAFFVTLLAAIIRLPYVLLCDESPIRDAFRTSETDYTIRWHHYNDALSDNGEDFNFSPDYNSEAVSHSDSEAITLSPDDHIVEDEELLKSFIAYAEESEFAQHIRETRGEEAYWEMIFWMYTSVLRTRGQLEAEALPPQTQPTFRARCYINDKRRPQTSALSHIEYSRQKVC